MQCHCRIKLRRGVDGGMTGNPKQGYGDQLYTVPGGQCMACRIRLTREWAARAMHESRDHDFNIFATLTYSDENLPYGNTLHKKHLQDFHKRLRKRRPNVRLLACGEYGDETDRPHYHGLYFNLSFEDQEHIKTIDGRPLYRSETLDRIWSHGHCNFYDDITSQSAGYVAGYTKKKTGKIAETYYQWFDPETGELFNREPEFKTQSLQPGIGQRYALRWINDIYPRDEIIHDGKAILPPRYYDKLCEKHAPDLWRRTKLKRAIKAREKERESRELANQDKSVVPYKGSDRHGHASEKILKSKKLSRNENK